MVEGDAGGRVALRESARETRATPVKLANENKQASTGKHSLSTHLVATAPSFASEKASTPNSLPISRVKKPNEYP